MAKGLKPVIANTHVEGFAWRAGESKSDKKDVQKLASMYFRGEIRGIVVPDATQRELRSMVSTRKRIVKEITRFRLRLYALVQVYWATVPAGPLTPLALEKFTELAADPAVPEGMRIQLHCYISAVKGLIKANTKIEAALRKRRTACPLSQRLLREVPGVGKVTAQAILAFVSDPKLTKKSARAAGAFVGLTPTRRQSGKTVINGRITKAGNATLRGLLTECAHAAIRSKKDPEWKARYLTLKGSRNDPIAKGKALTAIARLMLITCIAILKSGKPYDATKISPPEHWVPTDESGLPPLPLSLADDENPLDDHDD